MHAYLEKVKELLSAMREWSLTQLPHAKNREANLLAKIAFASPMNITQYISIKLLHKPSIEETKILLIIAPNKPTWKDDIIAYLLKGKLLKDKVKVHKLRCKVAAYTMIKGQLYKRGYSMPYLRCLNEDEALYVLQKVQKGVCKNHIVGSSFAHKIIRQRYYWSNFKKEVAKFIKRCDKCQRFINLPRKPLKTLTSINNP